MNFDAYGYEEYAPNEEAPYAGDHAANAPPYDMAGVVAVAALSVGPVAAVDDAIILFVCTVPVTAMDGCVGGEVPSRPWCDCIKMGGSGA